MASPLTDRIRAWGTEWIRPVYAAIYERDHATARQALGRARERLSEGDDGFSSDEAEATAIMLAQADYHINRSDCAPAELHGVLEQALEDLRQARHDGPIAAHVYHRSMLNLLVAADRDGVRELPPAEFDVLFNVFPPDERTDFIWHTVVTWLFDHRRLDLLGEAYEAILLATQMDLKQFPFRRVKLMHQLVSGKARDEEIIFYLEHLELHNAFEEFERFMLPFIEEQGLDTEQVRRMVAETRERFANTAPRSPY